jgi:hypothetical protein
MLGTGISIPRHVKIVGNRFGSAVNTTVDADIYVAADGILDLFMDHNLHATVDGCAYAAAPDAARYIKLGAGTSGVISNSQFACIADPAGSELTFGETGTGAIFPTTVRMVDCHGEGVVGSAEKAIIGRT